MSAQRALLLAALLTPPHPGARPARPGGEELAEARVLEARPDRLVLDRPGQPSVIALPPDLSVTYSGLPLDATALAPGDTVRVHYHLTGGAATASAVELLPRTGPAGKEAP